MQDLNAGSNVAQASAAAQSALTTLSRLGRIADAHPILEDASTISYDHISSDDSRTSEWKTAATSVAYTKTMQSVAERLTKAATIAATQNSDDSSRVFGVKNLPGDAASLAVSRRDATERAARITDPRERQALLKDAIDNGDPVMARSIARNAVQFGDLEAINQFEAANSTLSPAIQRLWDAARSAENPAPMAETFALGSLKPRTLATMADYQIAARAATPTNA